MVGAILGGLLLSGFIALLITAFMPALGFVGYLVITALVFGVLLLFAWHKDKPHEGPLNHPDKWRE